MSKDYWSNRELQKLKGQLKDVSKLEKAMKKQYRIALEQMNTSIIKLFMKYSRDNDLSYSDASQLLSGKEFNEWRMSLKEYIKIIEETADEELLLELNTLAMKSRISRLEEMFYQIDKQVNELYKSSYEGINELLEGAVKDSYYKSIFNMQKFLGVGKPFARISQSAIDEVLTYPWSGANYSRRIWNNRKKLKQVIRQEMTQMIIQGRGSKEVAKVIADKMNVDYRNAIRLVNTEHAYVMGEASAKGYKETGVEEYEILATLDNKTSKICQKQDGKVYKLDEKKVGINYPPFHVWCRTTTIPYFAEDEEDWKRTARDPGGKTYEVPADMKYKDWYDKHVGNSAEGEIAVTKVEGETLEDYRNKILNKEYNLKINKGSQNKHIKSSKGYIEGRSYLTIGIEEAQELVNKYAGTGTLGKTKNGQWDDKELITSNKSIIGYDKDMNTGEETPVSNFKIYYNNNGTHIVPTKRGDS